MVASLKVLLLGALFATLGLIILTVPSYAVSPSQRGATAFQVTAMPSSTTMPATPAPTVTPTVQAVSYLEMLDVYKEVLETNKWFTITLLTMLSASGLGGLYFFQRSLKGVEDLQSRSTQLQHQLEDSRTLNQALQKSFEELQIKLNTKATEVEALRQKLEEINRQTKAVQDDIKLKLPRLEALADIDTYAIGLFSGDLRRSRTARSQLVQLSMDENDAVVRRATVRVFGAMPKYFAGYDQERTVVDRLKEMALRDPEPGVRLEARHALREFGMDLDDGEKAS
jgi:hypothetical protein